MSTICECMVYAGSKDESIDLMRSESYEVKWTDERKYIAYTTPDDQRCRDNKLHETKYLKENMEHEFAIRQEALQRGVEGPEQTRSSGDAFAPQWSATTADKNIRNAHDADDGRGRGEDAKPDGQSEQPHSVSDGTGWENERELYYEHRKHGESFEEVRAQLNAYRESLNRPVGDSVLALDPVADALISTAVTLAVLSDTGPVRDATTVRQHADSKSYRERQRIAMGHKPDDHEDEETQTQTWTMTM